MSLALALLIALQSAPPAEEAEEPIVEEQAEEPEEKLVCRRRTIEDTKFGKSGRRVKVCKTRAEWEASRGR